MTSAPRVLNLTKHIITSIFTVVNLNVDVCRQLPFEHKSEPQNFAHSLA